MGDITYFYLAVILIFALQIWRMYRALARAEARYCDLAAATACVVSATDAVLKSLEDIRTHAVERDE